MSVETWLGSDDGRVLEEVSAERGVARISVAMYVILSIIPCAYWKFLLRSCGS